MTTRIHKADARHEARVAVAALIHDATITTYDGEPVSETDPAVDRTALGAR